MIKIAVVDDEEYSAVKCRRIIDSIGIKDLQVDIFIDSKHFCDVIFDHKEPFDIIILDIDMPGITGFDVARQIRNEYPDAIIMFYTAHDQYVFKSFEFQPFRYIRKECANSELPFAIQCAIKKMGQTENKGIIIKTNRIDKKIYFSEIRYVEKYKNSIEIFLSNGESYVTKLTLSEFFDIVSKGGFMYSHKSNIVNMRYIKDVTYNKIILTDDFEIPISRRNHKIIKQAFAEFLGDMV